MAVISATGIIASPTVVSAKRMTLRIRLRSKALTVEVRSAMSATERISSRVMNGVWPAGRTPTMRAASRAAREKTKTMG